MAPKLLAKSNAMSANLPSEEIFRTRALSSQIGWLDFDGRGCGAGRLQRRVAPGTGISESYAELSPEQLFVALNHAGSPVFDHAYRSGSGTLHTFVCEPAERTMFVGVGGDASPQSIHFENWTRGAPLGLSNWKGSWVRSTDPSILRSGFLRGGLSQGFQTARPANEAIRVHSVSAKGDATCPEWVLCHEA
jgi:hypothetical protein